MFASIVCFVRVTFFFVSVCICINFQTNGNGFDFPINFVLKSQRSSVYHTYKLWLDLPRAWSLKAVWLSIYQLWRISWPSFIKLAVVFADCKWMAAGMNVVRYNDLDRSIGAQIDPACLVSGGFPELESGILHYALDRDDRSISSSVDRKLEQWYWEVSESLAA